MKDYRIWGTDLEPDAVRQMENACRLPIAVTGALMPDAHVGYGLPIGGVLATRDAVIPYAVGVDIACRMKMTVLDLPLGTLDDHQSRLKSAIDRETCFGTGGTFRSKRLHDVLDADWSVSPVTARMKDRAWSQLGTSGSGNHFVEFGRLVVPTPASACRRTCLALLSHSGAAAGRRWRTTTKLAALHPELPPSLAQLAWLDLSSEAGQEYWGAMG
jgi:tRNA-splicing ligase RtcB